MLGNRTMGLEQQEDMFSRSLSARVNLPCFHCCTGLQCVLIPALINTALIKDMCIASSPWLLQTLQ